MDLTSSAVVLGLNTWDSEKKITFDDENHSHPFLRATRLYENTWVPRSTYYLLRRQKWSKLPPSARHSVFQNFFIDLFKVFLHIPSPSAKHQAQSASRQFEEQTTPAKVGETPLRTILTSSKDRGKTQRRKKKRPFFVPFSERSGDFKAFFLLVGSLKVGRIQQQLNLKSFAILVNDLLDLRWANIGQMVSAFFRSFLPHHPLNIQWPFLSHYLVTIYMKQPLSVLWFPLQFEASKTTSTQLQHSHLKCICFGCSFCWWCPRSSLNYIFSVLAFLCCFSLPLN